MDDRVSRSQRPALKSTGEAFSGLSKDDLTAIVLSVSDLTIIVDRTGEIIDTAFLAGSIFEEIGKSWIGEPWRETVTEETKVKIDKLLFEAEDGIYFKWRQVNHFTQKTFDIPVSYAIAAKNGANQLIAIGRSQHKLAEEQRRLVNSQLSMERSFIRLQSSEMRYRQIFQQTNEAMILVEGRALKITEANAAASRFLGSVNTRLEGRKLRDLFKLPDAEIGDALMHAALTGDTLSEVHIIGFEDQTICLDTIVLREAKKTVLIVQLSLEKAEHPVDNVQPMVFGAKALSIMPDGFIMVNDEGRIQSANEAVCDLLQVCHCERLINSKFDSWFERPGVDFNVLLSNLKKHGKVRRFSTTLRSDTGFCENVEISAVKVGNGAQSLFGFVVRAVGMTDRSTTMENGVLPYSAEQVTGLVGHMSLKEVVRETTSVIERLCIEAALELTDDNRASAAQLLGLSRQSLYDKLARHGFDENKL